MGRSSRVMSFMSQFGGPPKSPTTTTSSTFGSRVDGPEVKASSSTGHVNGPPRESPTPPRSRVDRPLSRPMSMIQPYQPPLMDIEKDTLPELQPIFTFLNSHSNKLYQEGYFLKLNDLDTHGRPNSDRVWIECFAQLVGTILSLWDATALDAAGQDGEVVPTFINLTDASVKMIEMLPTSTKDVQPLQNVLSISTAGRNRYLLHFNSLHSLTQWTAGIRLAMFEHSTLQELYTGSLIAGKGKGLNNIKHIMDRSKVQTEDWVRVRFGAGTPWRRCWCVISPPSEKEYQKQQKQMRKKSAYDRSQPILKGDIKFYDSKKTRKAEPIASISDAYSAYAIYPQSKPLIDQSTLVKVEGMVTIYSQPVSTSEGFVFVMPEAHPAVSGFEMMLRWLFPVFDTFALYGRPMKLIADTFDVRGLMFAMPSERRYGYLETLDVAGLILTDGSNRWREVEWRKHMKGLTSKRMKALKATGSGQGSRNGSRRGTRISLSLPSRSGNAQIDDGASTRSSPIRHNFAPASDAPIFSSPATVERATAHASAFGMSHHQRSVSESQGLDRYAIPSTTPLAEIPPPPPPHVVEMGESVEPVPLVPHASERNGVETYSNRSDSNPNLQTANEPIGQLPAPTVPEPVAAPMAFARRISANALPRPAQSPELRRAKSRMSTTTLKQLAGASGMAAVDAGVVWDHGTSETRSQEEASSFTQADADDGIDPFLYMEPSMGHRREMAMRMENADPRGATAGVHAMQPTTGHLVEEATIARPAPVHSDHPLPLPPAEAVYSPENVSRHDPQTYGQSMPRERTSRSVTRKPLPSRPNEDHLGRLQNHELEPEVLNGMMTPRQGTTTSDAEDPYPVRQNTIASSKYGSDSGPDYASTRPSLETRRSVSPTVRPRAGVMRTVGDVEPISREIMVGDTRYRPEGPQSTVEAEIPHVDFGPTYNLAPIPRSRPSSHGTMTRSILDGSRRVEPSRPVSQGYRGGEGSSRMEDAQRFSMSGGISGHERPMHARASSQGLMYPQPAHDRSGSSSSESDHRRGMAWQPGLGVAAADQAGNAMRRSLTPEQFVQHRAQKSRATPMYAHHRKSSSSLLRSETPPMSRQSSGDQLSNIHGRSASGEYGQRPMSRGGAGAFITPADYSSRLSAREQEHVARATGSSLLNMSGRNSPVPTGLVGAIEVREREKKEIRDGVSSQLVQHAIMQRRQQEAQVVHFGTPYQAGSSYVQTPPTQSWAPQSGLIYAGHGGLEHNHIQPVQTEYQHHQHRQEHFQQQLQYQPQQAHQQQQYMPYQPPNQDGAPGQPGRDGKRY